MSTYLWQTFAFFLTISSIRITRKSWHTLLNTSFHIAMTSAVFAGGITLTGYPIVCQAVSFHFSYIIMFYSIRCLSHSFFKVASQTHKKWTSFKVTTRDGGYIVEIQCEGFPVLQCKNLQNSKENKVTSFYLASYTLRGKKGFKFFLN